MKTIIIKTAAVLLILAGIISCGKEDEEPIKPAGTHWYLAGIADVETGSLRELELEYTDCHLIHFDTDTTAYGCFSANEIYLHLSPQQVFVVIKMEEDDSYTGDVQLFYDAIKTLTSYTLTKDELKIYCNKGKDYLLYKTIIPPNYENLN
jgi:hypothetical protein